MKREPTYVGIDVAKDRVDIAVRPTGQTVEPCAEEAGRISSRILWEAWAVYNEVDIELTDIGGQSRNKVPDVFRKTSKAPTTTFLRIDGMRDRGWKGYRLRDSGPVYLCVDGCTAVVEGEARRCKVCAAGRLDL